MKTGSIAPRIVGARIEAVGHAVTVAVVLDVGREHALRITMVMAVCMPHRRDIMRMHVAVSAVMAVRITYRMGHCRRCREKNSGAGEDACNDLDWVVHMHLHVETSSLHRGNGIAAR